MKTFIVTIVGSAILLGGCNRVEMDTRVQQVPKQPRPVMAMTAAGEIGWTVPKGWTQLPAQQMRLATFQVSPQHPEVVVTIVPLAGDGGGLLPNINRWAGQIGLPPTDEQGLAKLVTKTEIASHQVQLLDMMGPESAKPRPRMLVAIVPHQGQTFYFKLAGPADVVTPQKETFDQFIKSINFDGTGAPKPQADAGDLPPIPEGHPAIPGAVPALPEGHPPLPGAAAAGQAMAAVPAEAEEITYTAPQGWEKDQPLPFRAVSFHIGDAEKRVDLIVSKLPATGSGTYADNITRWRSQVSLPPLTPGQQQPSTPAIIGGIDSATFDFVGPGDATRAKRMLLAWVPKGEEWWFVKMLGPSDAVGRQEQNFGAFVKSIKFVEPARAAKP